MVSTKVDATPRHSGGEMPKFRIEVRNAKGVKWFEEYDKEVADPVEWARETLDNFNRTLGPGEHRRTLLRVEITAASVEHVWGKINAMTRSGRSGLHDVYKCSRCGVTGKRFTLDGGVHRDHKFKAKKYANCAHLKKADH